MNDQSITTQKLSIGWHRLAEDLETDVTHATCRSSAIFRKPGTKLVKQFRPSLLSAKNTPLCTCARMSRHCLSVWKCLLDVWVEALLLNIGASSKAISSLPFKGERRCQSVHCKQEEGRTRKRV